MASIKIRRKTGASSYDVIYPTADWSNIDNKPSTFTPTSHTHSGADITTGTVGTARLGTGTADSSTFLRGDGTWATPGGGERKFYNSISGTSGAWYDLFTVSDGATGALFVSIQTYAHDDLLFTVGTGYGPSAVNTITVLNCVYNPSGSFASITGVRVTDSGLVQAQFTWSSGPTVDIDVAVYGSGTLPTLSASLTANATSYTIDDTVSITGLQGKIRSENGFVQGTTPIPAGSGTANQITYWSGTNAVAALSTATYPSLTELSYVKGVTSALQTQIDGKAATSHTHTASQISDSGNVGRNLLTTSSATASTLFFKKNPDHTITLESDSAFRTSIGASPTAGSASLTTLGTVTTGTWSATTIATSRGGTGTTTSPVQGGVIFGSSTSAYGTTAAGTSGQFLQSAGTGTPVWANLTTNIQTITNLAPNTYSTSVSVSGYRWVIITGFKNSAGTEVIFQTIVDLNDANQWSTTARTRRIVWNNDTSTFADDLTIQDSTGLRLQFAAGINCNYRLDGVR